MGCEATPYVVPYNFVSDIRPWFKNVAKTQRKEPKWSLRDRSELADEIARPETFVACHVYSPQRLLIVR